MSWRGLLDVGWRSSGPILRGLCEGHTDHTHTCLGGLTKALWKYTDTVTHSGTFTVTHRHKDTLGDIHRLIHMHFYTQVYPHKGTHSDLFTHAPVYNVHTEKGQTQRHTYLYTQVPTQIPKGTHSDTVTLTPAQPGPFTQTQRHTKTDSKTLAYLSTQAGTREYILTKAHTYFVHTPVSSEHSQTSSRHTGATAVRYSSTVSLNPCSHAPPPVARLSPSSPPTSHCTPGPLGPPSGAGRDWGRAGPADVASRVTCRRLHPALSEA